MNQYDSVGGTTYSYDATGNLTGDSIHAFAYDYENRLTSATKTGMSATYTYDAFGRRTQKDVDGAITNFIYDGDQVLMETDATGSTTAKYIYGPGIDEPISMQRGSETYYYHFDGLGSVTALTDSSGTLTESYEYDIYGNITSSLSTVGNPYYFTSRRYDSETGLYFFRARYYSPSTGRFLQTDPIGYWGGLNLYTYCSNNPINWIDPFGWRKEAKNIPWWKRGWRAWSDFVAPDFEDPTSVGTNFWTIFYQERAWEKWHIDIGFTGGGPGKLKPAVNTGFKIAPFYGFYGYFGIGFGTGKGVTGTLEPGVPTKGVKITGTGRYGFKGGVKVSGTYSEEGISVVPSFGLGFGKGVAVTGTGTYEIFIWRRE